MKKILMSVCLLAGLAAVSAEDDYILYWQIVGNHVDGSSAAAVGTKDGSGNVSYLNVLGEDTQAIQLDADGLTEGIQVAHIGNVNPASYSFFVELVDKEGNSLWTSSYFAYNDLMNYIANQGAAGVVSGADVWSVTVPEPTSGLLLLMGLAGLALRRRRRVC